MMQMIFTIKEQNAPQPDTLYLDIRPGVRELRYAPRGTLHSVKLPLRQFKFVQALMANHPAPLTHWDLFYHIWGEGSSGRNEFNHAGEDGGPLTPNSCIQQYAAKLRTKLAHMGLTVRSERKGYGYQLLKLENNNEINETEVKAQAPAHDSSSQEAPEEVRIEAPAQRAPAGDGSEGSPGNGPPKAPRDPRGSKAGVPRKQVLKPVPDTGDHPSGITLSIERVGVR